MSLYFSKSNEVRTLLRGAPSEFEVHDIVAVNEGNLRFADSLFALICEEDDRIAFNALRILARFPSGSLLCFADRSDELVDRLLSESHTGRRRLLLSLLYRMPVSEVYARVDFIDYCFSAINSSEPTGIKALCLKHCLEIVRRYPELKPELLSAIECLEEAGSIPPGIKAVLKRM